MNVTIFDQQFNHFTDYLHTFALKLTNDSTAAQDLFQETAFLAFKNQDKFKPGTNMKGWLGTIMRNTFINDFRKRKKRGEILDKTDNNYILNSGKKSIHNEGEGKMTMEELVNIVDGLDEKFKKPFLMAYQGYRYDEICEHTDAALGTVKSRIFLARKALQAKIFEMYGERRPNLMAA